MDSLIPGDATANQVLECVKEHMPSLTDDVTTRNMKRVISYLNKYFHTDPVQNYSLEDADFSNESVKNIIQDGKQKQLKQDIIPPFMTGRWSDIAGCNWEQIEEYAVKTLNSFKTHCHDQSTSLTARLNVKVKVIDSDKRWRVIHPMGYLIGACRHEFIKSVLHELHEYHSNIHSGKTDMLEGIMRSAKDKLNTYLTELGKNNKNTKILIPALVKYTSSLIPKLTGSTKHNRDGSYVLNTNADVVNKARKHTAKTYICDKRNATQQRIHRKELLEFYDRKCAIYKALGTYSQPVNIPESDCHAAHIVPWRIGDYGIGNGILMHTTFHRAFDRGELKINHVTGALHLKPFSSIHVNLTPHDSRRLEDGEICLELNPEQQKNLKVLTIEK